MPKVRFDACGLMPDSKSSRGETKLCCRGPAGRVVPLSTWAKYPDSSPPLIRKRPAVAKAMAGKPVARVARVSLNLLVPLSYRAIAALEGLEPSTDASRQSRDLSPPVFELN